jgi:hypothetical protein
MKITAKTKADKHFYPPNPLEGRDIPKWGSVYDFMRWWHDEGCPMMPPDNVITCTDDATSISLFRCGQFQVELYLIHPSPNLPIHEHPDVEVIKLRLDSYQFADGQFRNLTDCSSSKTLLQGESHGAGINFKEQENGMPTGFSLLAFQKWKDGLKVTTVASRWKGKTVGGKQEKLIKKLVPTAIVREGYADTTGAP